MPRLEEGVAELARHLGVRPEPGGRHPAWGTRNALLALGPRVYLEILAPDPEAQRPPRLFGLAGVSRPRLVTWAAQAGDLEERIAAAGRHGVDLGRILVGQRRRPGGGLLSWRLTDPEAPREGGLLPFWIDWGASDHPARDAPGGCSLADLAAEHPEAARVGRLLASLGLELEVARGPRVRLTATLDTPRGRRRLA